jgi:hypothetical protein
MLHIADVHIRKYKTYYKRTSGKHVKAEPKKEEWGKFI